MEQLHFCGGLPRSGSTILMNVLQQNPRIFTTPTDPIPSILGNLLISNRSKEEFLAMDADKADIGLHGFAVNGVRGWYEALTDKPIVISKNRSWAGFYHLFPEGKYIAMIRDLRDIAESFDRVNSKFKVFHTFDDVHGLLPAMTEREKFDYYFIRPNPLSATLSYELPRVVEASKNNAREVLIIRYEDLIVDPYREINRVYSFLGEEKFQHDLNNIQQSSLYEHDTIYYRERTSHVVSPSILLKPKERRVSSDSYLNMIVERNIPYYEMFYPEVLR